MAKPPTPAAAPGKDTAVWSHPRAGASIRCYVSENERWLAGAVLAAGATAVVVVAG